MCSKAEHYSPSDIAVNTTMSGTAEFWYIQLSVGNWYRWCHMANLKKKLFCFDRHQIGFFMQIWSFYIIISKVTGQKLTKFIHDVAESSALNHLKSELRSCHQFGNAIEWSRNSLIFPKIGCCSNVLWEIGKRQSVHLSMIICLPFGENQCGNSWHNLSARNHY